ncbi:MAG: outer membrane beta-barrel protein [Flavobacteriales bacterium]|nr:outer membrane beta-barrel protein [Flavobacteriales bacterium]
MKKFITCCLLVSVLSTMIAQRSNEFQARAGFGWAAFRTTSQWTYTLGNTTFSENDTDGAVAVHVPVELRYEFNPRINAGLDLKFGSYLYDPDDSLSQYKSNKFSIIGLSGEFTAVSNENFRVYLGINLNTTSLTVKEELPFDITETQTWRGGGVQANVGFMAFFSKLIGVNFNVGYDSHTLKLKSYTLEGESQDLSAFTGTLKLQGVNGTIGLVLRL